MTYHKNDLEILTIATICPIPESDSQIERYHILKFSQSACILFVLNQPRMIHLN